MHRYVRKLTKHANNGVIITWGTNYDSIATKVGERIDFVYINSFVEFVSDWLQGFGVGSSQILEFSFHSRSRPEHCIALPHMLG
jgi:hypothetical protein